MRKKFFMAFMMIAAISLAGCGKKTTTTEGQATPEPTEAAAVSPEAETMPEEETVPEEVTAQTDDTGVYYGSNGVTELNVGRNTPLCTIKVPLNYILGGASYLQDGSEVSVKDLGATVTMEEGMQQGELPNVVTSSFSITSRDAQPTVIEALTYDTSEVGSYEELKEMFSDGKDVGTEDAPAWMYDAPETSHDPNADFVVMMPLSDSAVLTIYYQGPLTTEEGKEAAAQKVSNLVTKKQ